MSKTKSNDLPTVDQIAQHEVFKNGEVKRDTIRQYLERDIKGVHVLLTELLSSEECIEALTTVIYGRYVKFQKSKKAEPEIDFAKQEANGYAG